MTKKVEKPSKTLCHICGKNSVLYFDYKYWCGKCGSEPLAEFSKNKRSKIISEEDLNRIF